MWKYGIVGALFALVKLYPVPAGLTPEAWNLFAIYLAVIAGIILRPQSEPVVMIVLIGAASFFVPIGTLLSGFSNGTAWLVFSAFLICQAFVETGLGRRIAYYLIGSFGHSALGLSYGAVLTDLIISPATPSNTARTGGIVYPIFRSICETLGSTPDGNPRMLGAYFTVLMYQISLITGSMFITACAPNVLTLTYVKSVAQVDISWMTWMWAALVPGGLALLLTPLLLYVVYPPQLKKIDNAKEISRKGLEECGPMTAKEKILVALFILAILGWVTGSYTKINTTAVALLFLGGCLVCKLFTWDSVAANKSAWSTLIWYAGIIGISGALTKSGFFLWMGKTIQANMDMTGFNPYLVLFVILFLNIALRYLFASMAAYVVAIVPILLMLGLAANAPVMPLCFIICFSSVPGGMVTQYGGALGPVLFGTGYVDQASWWKCGALGAILNMILYMTAGLMAWKVMGF